MPILLPLFLFLLTLVACPWLTLTDIRAVIAGPTSMPSGNGEWYFFSNISTMPVGSELVSISCNADGGRIMLLDKHEGISTSSDGGNSWTVVPNTTLVGTSAYWWKVVSSGSGRYAYAIQYSLGMVYAASDYGSTWQSLETLGQKYWSSVTTSADGSRVFITQTGGNITLSSDFGVSWVIPHLEDPDISFWKDIHSSTTGYNFILAIICTY